MKILNEQIFGDNIRKIRESRGMTQEEVIAKLQTFGSPLSRSTYSIIEMGEGNIFVSDLVGLQRIFQVPYERFFESIEPSRPSRNREDE